jgi:hypothetical protein
MKKLLAMLLLLALPSIASAVESVGPAIRVPDTGSATTPEPTPKSWLFNDIFYVRAHICRNGVSLCGPDPLVSSGATFNAIIRIFSPRTEFQILHFLITDEENAVVAVGGGGSQQVFQGFNDFFVPFNLVDGVYKFISIAQGLSSGRAALSEYYRFRVGGPNSIGCCP